MCPISVHICMSYNLFQASDYFFISLQKSPNFIRIKCRHLDNLMYWVIRIWVGNTRVRAMTKAMTWADEEEKNQRKRCK